MQESKSSRPPVLSRSRRKIPVRLISSYIFDWIVVIVAAVVGYILGNIDPNKRPFSLEDRDISFPYAVKETVPTYLLIIASTLAPVVVILVIALVLVPGTTVPRGTPQYLIWRRKLWELHAGWLGLALSLSSAWFITNGLKNLLGKPRPDLLSRCTPDIANVAQYVVGGIANSSSDGQLVSSGICKNTDSALVQDGFRSFPSGHASASAAGLIYLSLFVASKFAVTFPFLRPSGNADEPSFSAFPSDTARGASAAEDATPQQAAFSAARREAAAPPIYLLVLTLVPALTAVFIASSRWFDFRHHGFDILFGFAMGTATAYFAFRFYHLPLSRGAGWAWGPRNGEKAWWAGVGSLGYATARERYLQSGDEEEGIGLPDESNAEANAKIAGESTGANVEE